MSSPRHKLSPLPFSLPALLLSFLDGRAQAFPISSPDLIACDDQGDPTFELELFLQSHLPKISPTLLARLSLPPTTTLFELDVPLSPTHLPDRLQTPLPIRFPCVLIHLPRARWVIFPTLQQHTLFIPPDADLEHAARAEIQRIITAEEPSPQRFLSLLPASTYAIHWLSVPLNRAHTLTAAAQARARQRALAKAAQKQQAISVLTSVSTPLHAQIDASAPPAFVHQDTALRSLTALMRGPALASVLILGPPLVGKSTLARTWLWHTRNIPNDTTRLYSLSGAQLMAGMSGLGQWQARIQRILLAAETLNAVLFFEDLRDLFAERSDNGVDLANAIKPFLDDNRVRVLACLSDDALDHLERAHAPFFAPFHRLFLHPLTPPQAADALRAYAPATPALAPDAVPLIIDLLHRYQPYQAFPGKASRFLDTLRALHASNPLLAHSPISASLILDAFSLQSGMPAFLLHDDQPLKRATLLQSFRRRVIGQDVAIDRLCDLLCTIKANLQAPQKPLATLLFLGPTGVGKTEVARALSELLFSSASRMLRFDMSEYADPDAPSRLIHGSLSSEGLLTRQVRQQPFSVLLLDEVEKAHPSVFDLLLQVCGEGRLTDAHGRTAFFFNTILIMTSNLGASSRANNLGFTPPSPDALSSHYIDAVNRHFRPEFVNRIDRIIPFTSLDLPQLRQVTHLVTQRIASRLGRSQHNTPLVISPKTLDALTALGADPLYGARALRRFLDLHLATPLSALLSAHAPSLHACSLHISSLSSDDDPLPSTPPPIDSLTTPHLRISLLPNSDSTPSTSATALAALLTLSDTRRTIHRALALPPVEQLLARRQQLVADLNDLAQRIKKTQQSNSPDPRLSAEMSRLQYEHADIDTLWQRTSSLLNNLHDAEELSLLALFDSQDPSPFLDDAQTQAQALHRLLVPLLLSQVRGRDAITLLIQEHDAFPALSTFLSPILDAAPSLRWSLSFHILSHLQVPAPSPNEDEDDPAASSTPQPWPPGRLWGPPLSPTRFMRWLRSRDDHPCSAIILSAEGPLCGALLALASGLHRWHNPPPPPQNHSPYASTSPTSSSPSISHLTLSRLAMRTSLSNTEWLSLSPSPPLLSADLSRLTPTREYLSPSSTRFRLPPSSPLSPLLHRHPHTFTLQVSPTDLWLHPEDATLPLLLVLEHLESIDASPSFIGSLELNPPDTKNPKKKAKKNKDAIADNADKKNKRRDKTA